LFFDRIEASIKFGAKSLLPTAAACGSSALRLEVDLSMQLDKKGIECSWPDLMRDLKRLQAVHLDLDGRSYRIRTDFEGPAYQGFKAGGVQPPGRVTMLN
jgi:hypothetical protein